MSLDKVSILCASAAILILIGAIMATLGSARAAFASQDAEAAIGEILHYKKSVGNVLDKAVYMGSFGLGGERHVQRQTELKQLQRKANEEEKRAQLYAAAALALGLGYILLPVERTEQIGLRRRRRVRRLVPVATIALIAGITLPMLSAVTAFDVPMVGEVIIESQSKSIFDTIQYLFQGDPFLAVLIALFSIVTPAAKLILLALLARCEDAPRLHLWVERLGRWAMTDVFVVALLLTFLALGTREQNAAAIEIGLYYFLVAALLPMIAMEILPPAQAVVIQKNAN